MNNKSKIKKIPPKDVDAFVDIVANAYTGFQIVTPEDRKKMKQRIAKVSRDPTIYHYGLYRALFEYGRSDISRWRYVDVVTAIFRTEQKPICHTLF